MIESVRMIFGLMSPRHQKLFFVLMFTLLINALMETLSLGVLFPVIFAVLDPSAINSIPMIKEFLDTYAPVRGREFILIALALACMGYVAKNGISAFFLWIRMYYIEVVVADITNRMFRKYMGEEFEHHLSRSSDIIIRDFTEAVNLFRSSLSVILDALTHITIGLGIIIFLLFVDTTLVLYFILVMTLLLLVVMKKLRTISIRYGTQMIEDARHYNQVVLSSFHSYKEIQVLKRKSFFLKLNNQIRERVKRTQALIGFTSQVPRLALEATIVVLAISAMGILYSQNQTPQFIIAKLGIFAFAALKLLPMFSTITGLTSSLGVTREGIEIINNHLNKEESIAPELEQQVNIPFKKSITLKNLYYHYVNEKGESVPVLKGIDITIKKNTAIGLVGSSGSGKTTLVDIIIGLLQPRAGEIIIDEESLQRKGIKGVWTNHIGYIPQQISLGNFSVKENIALGIAPEDINIEQVNKVLDIAQLKSFVEGLPNGIDTKIGEAGIKLSGGQRQRIGIARALYHEPEILVLDEATSALDNETERDFMSSLRQFNKNTTQIIIAHRLSTVKNCDHIYILHQGKVVEEGTYKTLEKKGIYFRKMLLKKEKQAKKP